MAKYLLIWEVDMSRFPADPKDIMGMNMKTLEMVKQALQESGGVARDWGCFMGGTSGYAIGEGEAADVAKAMWQFSPYYKFEVEQVFSADEVISINKSMMP